MGLHVMGLLVRVPVHVSTIVAAVYFCTDDSGTSMARFQLFIIAIMTKPGK